MNIDLVVWAAHPEELTTYSGTSSTYIDLKTLLRDSDSPPVGATAIPIKSMFAGDSIYVRLQPTVYQLHAPAIPGINVVVNPDGGSFTSPPYYVTFFHPDGFRCDYPAGSGCPTPHRELGAFADDAETAVASTYDFRILDAGTTGPQGDVTLDAAFPSGPTVINIQAYIDVRQRSGDVHIHTNGFINATEKARSGSGNTNPGDLRVGQIQSTNGDVTLWAPGAILDADNDIVEVAYDAIDTAADVIGRNITMTAGDNTGAPARNGDPAAKSGHGGVGVPRNFLEIRVNGVGGALGVLTVTDTASERTPWDIDSMPPADPAAPTGTYGVFITQTTGDMTVNRILTNGDASLVALNGSIVDARFGGAGDNTQFGRRTSRPTTSTWAPTARPSRRPRIAATSARRDRPATRISSATTSRSTPGTATRSTRSTTIVGRVAAEARNDIYLTETEGALNLLIVQALGGNARLSRP